MLVTTLILGALAIVLLVIGYRQGNGAHIDGTMVALKMAAKNTPLLIFAFLCAGLLQALIPEELISRWLGAESGWKGWMIASVAGSLTPGGPYVSLPIAAGLARSGASVGAGVAFLSGWAIWGAHRLPLEFGILGWRFTLIKLVTTLIVPPLAGWIAHLLFAGVKITS
ncbi:MAG: permease [Candidatus Poribacteria bacterium]|nr:permease [Candidatus Poribacteria bacterium]